MLVNGFSDGGSLFDVTPVENMFIAEYMLRAPGDYVKVYLLALKLCYHPQDDYSTADMARELDISEDDVKNALVYWAQCSLIELISRRPFKIRFKNIKQMLQNEAPSHGKMYQHQELIMQIQQTFGGRRLLNTADTKRVIGWAEILKWSPEMIALVTSWCVDKKGKWVHFTYIDTVVNNMAEQGIDTYDKAEVYISKINAKDSGAARVLAEWNEHRTPTPDEINIYEKWTAQWGFDAPTIREAQKSMVGVTGNKFRYLDGILKNWHSEGIHSAAQAVDHLTKSDHVRDVIRAIGMNGKMTDSRIHEYDQWLQLGFQQESIVLVAKALARENNNSFSDLDTVLRNWADEGMVQPSAIQQYLQDMETAAQAMNEIIKVWGETRSSNRSERRAYQRWTAKGFSMEQILAAAELSVNAQKRLSYMNAILHGGESGYVKAKHASKANQGMITDDYDADGFEDFWTPMEDK